MTGARGPTRCCSRSASVATLGDDGDRVTATSTGPRHNLVTPRHVTASRSRALAPSRCARHGVQPSDIVSRAVPWDAPVTPRHVTSRLVASRCVTSRHVASHGVQQHKGRCRGGRVVTYFRARNRRLYPDRFEPASPTRPYRATSPTTRPAWSHRGARSVSIGVSILESGTPPMPTRLRRRGSNRDPGVGAGRRGALVTLRFTECVSCSCTYPLRGRMTIHD